MRTFVKKILYAGILIMLIGGLSFSASALYTQMLPSLYSIEKDITINVEDVNRLSEEQIEKITDVVIDYHCNHVTSVGSTPYGLTCVLLGHDTQTNMVSVIEHKVRATVPRCLETKYKVTTCSRCDYENIEYVLEKYISCCD